MSGEIVKRTFIGKILKDGHLSLPEDAAREVGKTFRVVLLPTDEARLPADEIVGRLAEINKLGEITEADIDRIIQEVRETAR